MKNGKKNWKKEWNKKYRIMALEIGFRVLFLWGKET